MNIIQNIKLIMIFLVINDCSTDSTLKICKGNDIPVISLVHNLGNWWCSADRV